MALGKAYNNFHPLAVQYSVIYNSQRLPTVNLNTKLMMFLL